MFDKIKKYPTSVKLSVGILIIGYLVLLSVAPFHTLVATLFSAVVASLARILLYITHDE